MKTPRVAALHDVAGVGRCSLAVIAPALSAMGSQCCPLPTAVLSSDTGGFGEVSFLDLTQEMGRIAAQWKRLDLTFDAIYSGFLGSEDQIAVVEDFFSQFGGKGVLRVVDPVMADHGKLYRTYTPGMCAGMGRLVRGADLITPNLTEAAILLGESPDALLTGALDAEQAALRLSRGGECSVVLTGYSREPGTVGALCFDRETGALTPVQTGEEPGAYPGTGDLFTSVLLGGLLRGAGLAGAAQGAAEFIRECIRATNAQGTEPRYGVAFETQMWRLLRRPAGDD